MSIQSLRNTKLDRILLIFSRHFSPDNVPNLINHKCRRTLMKGYNNAKKSYKS